MVTSHNASKPKPKNPNTNLAGFSSFKLFNFSQFRSLHLLPWPRRPAVSLFSFPNRPTENHFSLSPSFPSSPNLLIKSISKVNRVNDVKGNEIHRAYFKPVIKACWMRNMASDWSIIILRKYRNFNRG